MVNQTSEYYTCPYHSVSDIHPHCAAVHMYKHLSYTPVFCDHMLSSQLYM